MKQFLILWSTNNVRKRAGAATFPARLQKLRHPTSGDGFSFILPSPPDFRHERKINPRCDSPHHVNITALLWVCSTQSVREAVGRRLRLLSSLNGVDSVQTLWPCEGDWWRASMRAKEYFWRHPARLFGLHPARLIIKGPRMSTIRVMFYIFYALPAAQNKAKKTPPGFDCASSFSQLCHTKVAGERQDDVMNIHQKNNKMDWFKNLKIHHSPSSVNIHMIIERRSSTNDFKFIRC